MIFCMIICTRSIRIPYNIAALGYYATKISLNGSIFAISIANMGRWLLHAGNVGAAGIDDRLTRQAMPLTLKHRPAATTTCHRAINGLSCQPATRQKYTTSLPPACKGQPPQDQIKLYLTSEVSKKSSRFRFRPRKDTTVFVTSMIHVHTILHYIV